MWVLAYIAALCTLISVGQTGFGWICVRRFRARRETPAQAFPVITVLKPLHGEEKLLEEALASICNQDYPAYQVVFGVTTPADPALAVVERLRSRFPGRDISVVAAPAAPARNRKVANLINMLPAARHDVLVIADSDVHAAPDYLRRIAAALAEPATGLVTTLYAGLVASRSVVAALGATSITHSFLPGALMARRLGRQDCLGATMALTRETLASIGGFAALVHHLADDHVLGKLVEAKGLAVRLASTVPATTVAETRLRDLFRHELRWGRTIRALEPLGYAASILQYPAFWALLALAFSGGAVWAVGLLLGAWAVRGAVARGIDRALGLVSMGLATPAPIWLLPVRDVLSALVVLVSHVGTRVEWRGQVLHTDRGVGDRSWSLDQTPSAT
jgi:ceramide glucosyltransferase